MAGELRSQQRGCVAKAVDIMVDHTIRIGNGAGVTITASTPN